jgi:AraC-like DNA-binding protein
MSATLNESREIRPSIPDEKIQALLALDLAQIHPLSTGNLRTGRGMMDTYTVIAAVGGNLTVTTHAQYALLKPGQLFVIRGDVEYSLQAVSGCTCMILQLRGTLVEELLYNKLVDGWSVMPWGATAVRELVMSLTIVEEECGGKAEGEQASTLAYGLLMKLYKLPVGRDAAYTGLVETAIAIIQEEFPFLDGLDELAKRLEVSKAHLSRSFAKTTGVSPGKYIVRVKVEYAKLLMQDRSATIAYVAEASGFANANYFSKVFRRETGMSPTEYLDSLPPKRSMMIRPRGLPPVW